ncbi:MAG: glycosyltransferase family 4 protein [Betaproteobacteria bacterium]|nr:glycosyltransferase family 4 protein [Betaproteobacteria bacterium]
MQTDFDNILIVSPGYPRWKGDYTHPMVYNVARLLRAAGHKIKVVTIHYPGIPDVEEMDEATVVRARYAPEKYEVMGSEGGLIDDIRGSLLCKFLLLPMLAALAWHTFRHAKNANLILVQWIPTAVVALPAKFLLRRPLILHSRTYPDTTFWRRVYRFLLPFADGVIYNSHDNRRLTDSIYPHRYATVIGSGINLQQFGRPSGWVRSSTDTWKLITVARLVEFKGLEYAIRAVKLLKDRGRNVHLEIVGEGPLREDLERLIDELDLAGEVALGGALAHGAIPARLWDNDLFLISSIVDSKGRTEGFGAVILEAMAAGLPVVASAVGGITDIVDGENGVLVPEKNPTAIADAIETVLSDAGVAQSYAQRGQSFVQATYSDEALAGKYRDFMRVLAHHEQVP